MATGADVVTPPSYRSVYVTVVVACVGGLAVLYSLRLLGMGFAQGPLQPIFLTVLGAAALALAFGSVLTWMMRGMSRSMDEEGALFPGESPHDLPEAGKVHLAQRREARKEEIVSELRSIGRLAQRSSELGSDTTLAARFSRSVLDNVVRLRWRKLKRRLVSRTRIRMKEIEEARRRLESRYPATSAYSDSEENISTPISLEDPSRNVPYKASKAHLARAQPPRVENVKLVLHGTHHVQNETIGEYVNPVYPVAEAAERAGLSVLITTSEPKDTLVLKHYSGTLEPNAWHPIVWVMGDVEEVAAILIEFSRQGLDGFEVETARVEDDPVFKHLPLPVALVHSRTN